MSVSHREKYLNPPITHWKSLTEMFSWTLQEPVQYKTNSTTPPPYKHRGFIWTGRQESEGDLKPRTQLGFHSYRCKETIESEGVEHAGWSTVPVRLHAGSTQQTEGDQHTSLTTNRAAGWHHFLSLLHTLQVHTFRTLISVSGWLTLTEVVKLLVFCADHW